MKTVLSQILNFRLLIIIAVSSFISDFHADAQMCQFSGNVEVSVTPETGTTSAITYKFKNYNDYPVTVEAKIQLIASSDGSRKEISRVIVIPAGEIKNIKLTSAHNNNKNIAAADCGVIITVMKCD